jgi:hypothetical protein
MATSVLEAHWLVILGSRDELPATWAGAAWLAASWPHLPAFQARFRAAMKRLWRRYAIVSTDL